jgi:chaperone modulatory protein CbpM
MKKRKERIKAEARQQLKQSHQFSERSKQKTRNKKERSEMKKEKLKYRFTEITQITGIENDEFLTYLQNEWIIPADSSDDKEIIFDEEDRARAALIRELKEDFDVNDQSVPVILHLIDEIHSIRKKVSAHIKGT